MNWRNRIAAMLALVALCYCLAPDRVEAGIGKIQAVVNQMFGGSISAAGATDGQSLVWQASTGSWVPGAAEWVGTATGNLDMAGNDIDLNGGALTDTDNTVNVSKSVVVTGSVYASGGALVASAAGLSNPAYIEQFASGVLGITSDGSGGTADGTLRVAYLEANTSVAGPHPFEDFTANDTLTAAESGKVCTNDGAAGAVRLTLPSTTTGGLFFTFCVHDIQELQVIAQVGKTITSTGGTVVPSGDYIVAGDDGTLGSFVTLVSTDDGNWVAIAQGGRWTTATA